MIFIAALGVGLAVFWPLAVKAKSERWGTVGVVGSVLCGVVLFVVAISLPICWSEQQDRIVKFKAFSETIWAARANKNLSEMERAAILTWTRRRPKNERGIMTIDEATAEHCERRIWWQDEVDRIARGMAGWGPIVIWKGIYIKHLPMDQKRAIAAGVEHAIEDALKAAEGRRARV